MREDPKSDQCQSSLDVLGRAIHRSAYTGNPRSTVTPKRIEIPPVYAPSEIQARLRAYVQQALASSDACTEERRLLSLAQAVEARDPATGQHCQRVSVVCSILGKELQLTDREMLALQRGAFLHDIGKIAVPDRILFKIGPLDEREWNIMRTHTVVGEQICSDIEAFADVLPIIRSHHERWDGSGYPDNLRGDEIPYLARVIQIADIFDALTAVRPYKPAFTAEQAFEIITDEMDRGWRDPEIVAAFQNVSPLIQQAAVRPQTSLLALTAALEVCDVPRQPEMVPPPQIFARQA